MSGIIGGAGSKSGVIGQTVAGGMVHLKTITTGATPYIRFTGYFSSQFDLYKFYFSISSEVSNRDAAVQYIQTGGALIGAVLNGTQQSGDYRSVADSAYNANTADPPHNGFGVWDKNYILLGSQDQTASGQWPVTGELLLHHPLSTTKNKIVTSMSLSYNSGNPPSALRNVNMAGLWNSSASIEGLQFSYDTSDTNKINGTVSLYGIRN